jgi:serine/threonine-protein kinase
MVEASLAKVLDLQRERWRQGERVPVETYLEQHPDLSSHTDAVLDLIYHEILLREEDGDVPTLEEYRRRFPHLEKDLALQFAVDGALDRQFLDPPESTSPTWRNECSLMPPPELCDAPRASDFPPVCPLPSLPGYEILEVLGRGGMGVVYKARQISLNRMVAVKMLLAGAHAGPEELARFQSEAETAARLQHANIVQVYEIGVHEGQPFIALEFMESSLAKSLAGTPLPPRQAATWAEMLARAGHYAHQRGIIHRDLKPANVLLSRDGVLKIADFGMAKIVLAERTSGRARAETTPGDIFGTPSYMAPEQADGRVRQIGPATDVYGLGAILYEMLTGRPPFCASTILQTLEDVCLREPVPPSRLQPSLPRDLEVICLTCLQKKADRRYASAQALADDLHAFLADEAIVARSPPSTERLARWVRRRPREAMLTAAAIVALVALGVGILWSSIVALSAAAGLVLLAGGSWYSLRLRRAFRELNRQQLLAQRQVERLYLLLELTRRLIGVSRLEPLLQLLAETTVRLAEAELVTIYLVDQARGELCSKVTLNQDVGEIRLPFGVGIAGTVAVTGEPINIPDAYADPRFNPDIDRRTGRKTRNLLTVPITAQDGRVLGVFQVMNKREGAFEIDDVTILSSLAASAAVAIGHALVRDAGGDGVS